MTVEQQRVQDGRLMPRSPGFEIEVVHEGAKATKYRWEPGDMTRYEMTVVPLVDEEDGWLVLIKEEAALFRRRPLSASVFMRSLPGLAYVNSLPAQYQYLRMLHFVAGVPVVPSDIDQMEDRLRDRQYPALWPSVGI